MNQGWIKLHRQIADNPLWKCESFSRGQAWVDLILLANHKNSFFYKRGIKIDVKRGQLGISEKGLSDRWKWSRNKVKKFLKDLEKEHQIKIEKSNVTQVVTVLNYNEFQQERTPSGTPNDTPKGHQKDTYKNDNNEKEDNIDEIVNDIYNLYPTKCFINGRAITKGKKCKDKIKTLLNKSETKESLEAKIKWILKTRKRDGIFLSDFTTFLNNLPDLDFEPPKNKFESYMQELKEDDSKKIDSSRLYKDLEAKLITPEQFKDIKQLSDSNYIKFVNRA